MVHYIKPNYQCPETSENFEEIKHCDGSAKGSTRCEQYHGHSPMGIIYCSSESEMLQRR